MYRTYSLKGNEKMELTKQYWTGDCYAYVVFENKEEKEAEEKRIAKIEENFKREKEEYLKNCTSY